jgi:hypothetical protein
MTITPAIYLASANWPSSVTVGVGVKNASVAQSDETPIGDSAIRNSPSRLAPNLGLNHGYLLFGALQCPDE